MSNVIVVGAGPAGLMAAEVLAQAGVTVDVVDAMPSVGRKFLLAGKGGLNLTHSEPLAQFLPRYGARQPQLARLLAGFGPDELRAWVQALGISTFVGSSGRVFPTDMKAAPLLRAWLHRLRAAGVRFHMREHWLGWDAQQDGAGALRFATQQGEVTRNADAVVLALGGASWARLGSDGAWVPLLAQRGVPVAPLVPANCGFDKAGGWTEHFASRFAGQPFKSVAIRCTDAQGNTFERKGEFVATATGLEGSLVYAASAGLRDQIAAAGQATLTIDLLPARTAGQVLAEVKHPRGSRSLSSHLKSRLGLDGIKTAVLHEVLDKTAFNDPAQLAATIKAVPITLVAARPIDEAISTAGGVPFEAMDDGLMLKDLPGVFCAGEMLDWEAPTGGYLLTACFASGRVAGQGAQAWLQNRAR
ncbi:MAG: TIGR03862 family flavoprotein [Ramlibacter sp.]|jgi:uncharacterized flavoprotein (TIGR03862 family)|nr:TIGR03862 family flavoprotein [Ramlibacter sp.]